MGPVPGPEGAVGGTGWNLDAPCATLGAVRVRVWRIEGGGRLSPAPDAEQGAPPSGSWTAAGTPRWADVLVEDESEFEGCLADLGLPPVLLETGVDPNYRPRAAHVGGVLYLECPVAGERVDGRRPYLVAFCFPGLLLTLHRRPVSALEKAVGSGERDLSLGHDAPLAALLHLLDCLVDENLAAVLAGRTRADELEHRIEDDPASLRGRDLLESKRGLSPMESTLEDQLYCLDALIGLDTEALAPQGAGGLRETMRELQASQRHARRLATRTLERVRELQQAFELYVSRRSEARLRLLTVLSAVFLPLSLVTGIFGMNFLHMPGLEDPQGFWILMASMAVLAGGSLLVMRARGWFD